MALAILKRRYAVTGGSGLAPSPFSATKSDRRATEVSHPIHMRSSVTSTLDSRSRAVTSSSQSHSFPTSGSDSSVVKAPSSDSQTSTGVKRRTLPSSIAGGLKKQKTSEKLKKFAF